MQSLRHFVYSRPRLVAAFGLGGLVALILPAGLHLVTSLLISWNVVVWSYLLLMAWLMMRADQTHIQGLAEQEDRGAILILTVMSIAAVASLAAIVVELSALKDLGLSERLLRYAFTASTVLGSWCLVAVLFTFHYALVFYRSPDTKRALSFPEGEQNPDYWDFLYFSFTIAVAAQTSDVTIMNKTMRKTVLAQTILSFLFNVAILGLSINIAAGLVGS
jgi:uncharacterized membrane protein